MPASIKHLTNKKLNLTSLLAKWKDGLYYSAAVVKCDKANKKCLVCFEDGSEIWVTTKDVHIQLSVDQLNQEDDIVCCLCDDGSSQSPNEIILCDVCQQGYHQKCHSPPVDSSTIDESDDNSDHKDWFCATCSYILNQSDRDKLTAKARELEGLKLHEQPKEPSNQRASRSASAAAIVVKSQESAAPTQSSESPKSSPKVKNTLSSQSSEITPKKSIVGPIKTTTNSSHRQTPYYPLSNQVRAAATSAATAALASMTANSAMVVGGTSGRTKQDLLNQSYKSTQQRQQQPTSPQSIAPRLLPSADTPSPPMKNAVRKSGVNFPSPIRQSALPIATRSPISTVTTTHNSSTVSTSLTSARSPNQPASPQAVSSTSPISNVVPITRPSNKQLSSSNSGVEVNNIVGGARGGVSEHADRSKIAASTLMKPTATTSVQADSQTSKTTHSATSPSSTTTTVFASPSKSVSCTLLTSKLVTLGAAGDSIVTRSPIIVPKDAIDTTDPCIPEASCSASVTSTNNNDGITRNDDLDNSKLSMEVSSLF